jgi:hypothetical protein
MMYDMWNRRIDEKDESVYIDTDIVQFLLKKITM